jgi:hypothetical protein
MNWEGLDIWWSGNLVIGVIEFWKRKSLMAWDVSCKGNNW